MSFAETLRQEGRQVGRQEGRQKTVADLAQKMFVQEHLSIDTVVRVTGLSKAEIEKLKDKDKE